jgi:hypothetical protein
MLAPRREAYQQTDTEIAHPKVGVMTGESAATILISEITAFATTMSTRKPSGIVMPFLFDGHRELSFEADAGTARFESRARGMHRYQQAWTSGTMGLDSEPDDFFREDSLFQHEELHDALWPSVFSVVKTSEG